MLSRESREPAAHVVHDRLQLAVSVLPGVDEAAVVLPPLGTVAARFGELSKRLIGRGERERVIKDAAEPSRLTNATACSATGYVCR